MQVKNPTNTIDLMIRQTRVHHMQLSIMADFKANLLLTVSTLSLPLAATLHDQPGMTWAMRVLVFFSVITILLAIYAVMPKLGSRRAKATLADVDKPSFNLLFFGDYMHLDEKDYRQAMQRIMNDTDAAYDMMLRELYTMGRYLAHKKFRYLGYAYISFILGVVGCFIALVLGRAF
jgi:hypothetical protein